MNSLQLARFANKGAIGTVAAVAVVVPAAAPRYAEAFSALSR